MQTILVFRTTKLECWSRKFAGIQAFARNRDWRLQTIDCTGGTILVAPLLDFWHPAGCIVESDGASTNIRPRDFGQLPAVFLDHSPELVHQGASVVRHDSARIAQLAARELLERDFASYAVIGWHHPVYWAQDKIDAFQKALALHGRRADVFQPRPAERDDITTLQRRLQKWLLKLPRPCGVFGVNDLVCEIALSAATALGISIPEDLAFVGADDDPLICETTIPSLTSVQPDFFQTGLTAAELLAERMEDPSRPARLRVVPPLQLVRRLSSRLFQRSDLVVKKALGRIEREAVSGLTARGPGGLPLFPAPGRNPLPRGDRAFRPRGNPERALRPRAGARPRRFNRAGRHCRPDGLALLARPCALCPAADGKNPLAAPPVGRRRFREIMPGIRPAAHLYRGDAPGGGPGGGMPCLGLAPVL